MKKINILQLSTGLGVGGAEQVILALAKNLNVDLFDNHVIGLSKSAALNFRFEEAGIKTIILNKDKSLLGFRDMISYVNHFVKENSIDVIHAHMPHALFVASTVKLMNPHIKIVFTSHNTVLGGKLRDYIIFLLKPLRDIDILFSEEQFDYKYKFENVLIPNGIDIGSYDQKCEKYDKFTFLAVGRLYEAKNHTLLIESAKSMKANYSFQILIAGDGPLRNELQEEIESNDLQDCVKLLGMRSDISELLNKVHCFVMPSLWEGLPIAILEAGAARVPVISTPVGSIPFLLNNENAYLSSHEQFSKTMIGVMDNYETAMQKAEKLKEKVIADFSLVSMLTKHENAYTELLEK